MIISWKRNPIHHPVIAVPLVTHALRCHVDVTVIVNHECGATAISKKFIRDEKEEMKRELKFNIRKRKISHTVSEKSIHFIAKLTPATWTGLKNKERWTAIFELIQERAILW